MKTLVNVILKEGTDKQEFVDSFNPETEADWWNMMEAIPNMIVMNVEESYLEDFKKDPRILSSEQNLFDPVPSDLPSYYTTTKTVLSSTSLPSTTNDGRNYMPLQFYLDTDIIPSTQKIGAHSSDVSTINDATYFNRWTGKNVDVVSLEVGPISSSYNGLQNSHPDFKDIDNPSVSRVVPMNWSGLVNSSNNQTSSNALFSSHAMGVLSASCGAICGFAKRSSIRVLYLITGVDTEVECINAVISWHNSKPINPNTGVKNPTILINEYQYLRDRYTGVEIDTVTSIVDLNGTVNRPGSTWGTDFTPFVSRNIIPWKVFDPATSTWKWCVVFPIQSNFASLWAALESAWDAGIVIATAAGNNGGVYVKNSDPRMLGVKCTTPSTSYSTYDIRWGGVGVPIVTKNTSTSTTWYPFIMYGPAGQDKGIDVAAGQNSETHQILDPYSTRGPGIDIIGLGSYTWTASPSAIYSDGNYWGNFGGTSCATPTVVGKMACMMEEYFTYNGRWPTPNEIKSIVISRAKPVVKSVDSTTWSSVPTASTNYSVSEFTLTTNNVNQIRDGVSNANGGYRFGELAGTTTKRCFINAQSFDRSQTQNKRPVSGKVYPRPKIRRTP